MINLNCVGRLHERSYLAVIQFECLLIGSDFQFSQWIFIWVEQYFLVAVLF